MKTDWINMPSFFRKWYGDPAFDNTSWGVRIFSNGAVWICQIRLVPASGWRWQLWTLSAKAAHKTGLGGTAVTLVSAYDQVREAIGRVPKKP